MDNQQRRLEDRLCWLGGIIDGEGCVTATIGHTKTSKGHVAFNRRYTPVVGIVNTDELLIKEVLSIFDELGLPYHVYERTSAKHPTWKKKWEIMINGMKRCKRAVEILEPYIFGQKKQRMQALGKWIDYRLGVDQKKPYTEKDIELLSLIRQSSTTLRDYTPVPTIDVGEDIVHAVA